MFARVVSTRKTARIHYCKLVQRGQINCRVAPHATGNEVAGTPGYMAIEVEQKGTADVLSDVFSAGVTLLELWVGSIGPTFDQYEGVDEVGPEGAFCLVYVRCWLTHT